MKMADEYDLYKLSIKEQQTLKSYLKNYITGGVKTESDQIDGIFRAKTLLSKHELRSKTRPEEVKKRELKASEKLQELIEREKTMSVNDFLFEREIKIENRTTVMENPHYSFLNLLMLSCNSAHFQDSKKMIPNM